MTLLEQCRSWEERLLAGQLDPIEEAQLADFLRNMRIALGAARG